MQLGNPCKMESTKANQSDRINSPKKRKLHVWQSSNLNLYQDQLKFCKHQKDGWGLKTRLVDNAKLDKAK